MANQNNSFLDLSGPATIITGRDCAFDGYVLRTRITSGAVNQGGDVHIPSRTIVEIEFVENPACPTRDTMDTAKMLLYRLLKIAELQRDSKAITEIEGALSLLEL
jgi:hypothetical protein